MFYPQGIPSNEFLFFFHENKMFNKSGKKNEKKRSLTQNNIIIIQFFSFA